MDFPSPPFFLRAERAFLRLHRPASNGGALRRLHRRRVGSRWGPPSPAGAYPRPLPPPSVGRPRPPLRRRPCPSPPSALRGRRREVRRRRGRVVQPGHPAAVPGERGRRRGASSEEAAHDLQEGWSACLASLLACFFFGHTWCIKNGVFWSSLS